jgi:hypothetical protein
MKKYVSLGAALMMGTVIAKDKKHKNQEKGLTKDFAKRPTHKKEEYQKREVSTENLETKVMQNYCVPKTCV